MVCETCGEKHKKCGNCNKDFPRAVVEINNPEEVITLLRKVVIPASMGTEEQVPAAVGKYHNVVLYYEANKHTYIYSSDGIPTFIETEIPQELIDRIETLEVDVGELDRDLDALDQEVQDLKNSPDVVDIVSTYADLQAYDTSSLGDKAVIRVLTDETHDGESSYYRWSTATQTWTFIGATGPYYTKSETDTLLNGKQNTLTAGSNITISEDTISATDTTYNVFTGTDGVDAGTSGLVPAPVATDEGKVLGADGTWVQGGPEVVQTTGTSQSQVMSQNATTSMIFSDPSVRRHIMIGDGATNTGSGDGSVAIGYNAHAHGDTVSIGTEAGNDLTEANCQINIGHGAGNNSAQDYSISIGYFAEADYYGAVAIGSSSSSSEYTQATKRSSVAIGTAAKANGERSVALGNGALVDSTGTRSIALEGQCYARGAVALGAGSAANTEGTVDVGAAWHMNGETWGYLGSDYRRITGVYDGQALHDAATLAQGNTLSDSAPTTSTVGVLGQLYTDTTNMHTYQCTYIDDSDPNVNPVYTWTQRW